VRAIILDMKWAFIALLAFLPDIAAAQQLVPVACSGPSAPLTCGSCELVAMINNVIQFVIVLATIIAAIILVWAGFLLVTSAGNTSQLEKAKGLFFNVVIGLIVLLAAFLIVNTILAALLNTGSPVYNWQTIECVYPDRPADLLDYRPTSATIGAGTGLIGDNLLADAFFSNEGICSQDFLGDYFTGDDVAIAACVAQGESACGAYFESTVDLGTDGNAFSLSGFQINLSVHDIENCAQYGASSDYLNCTDAFSGTDFGSSVSNEDIYIQCAEALADPRCAAENASRLRERDGWGIWTQYEANGCNRL